MDYLTTYNFWVNNVKDASLQRQLQAMKDDPQKIENAFYKDLEFGTAGLRGTIGVGTNCLNIYTIMRTTMGVSMYMKAHNLDKVAISYDSRIKSKLFAETTSKVLNSQGIKTYLVDDCMPTPFCSYMTRYYGCGLGVMITASHNPKIYNGYKVYSADGAQLLEDPSNEISKYVETVNPFDIKTKSLDFYKKQGLVEYIDEEIIKQYLSCVKKQSLNPMKDLNVVYTALNGTGYKLVPAILNECGLKVDLVKEQSYPNGNFTTCPKPNPEKAEALSLAIRDAKLVGSDMVLATDPDCDRVGIAVLNTDGEYRLFTGNEVGALLTEYILSNKQLKGQLTQDQVIIKSLVSTSLAEKIASDYGISCVNVLTGFKYIGNYIYNLEKQNQENNFLFGFEESYGYLAGSYVRDKDAVLACMLICEMASYYKHQGLSLIDKLNQLYDKYGYYKHLVNTYEFAGASGNKRMKELLNELRQKPICNIGDLSVVDSVDYLTQTIYDLPKANMIVYSLSNGGSLIIRPSGTEPLIKTYITVNKTPSVNTQDISTIQTFLKNYMQ